MKSDEYTFYNFRFILVGFHFANLVIILSRSNYQIIFLILKHSPAYRIRNNLLAVYLCLNELLAELCGTVLI